LPGTAEEFQVLGFLEGLDVSQVMLLPDGEGRKKAIAKLASPVYETVCLGYNNKLLSGKQIIVQQFSEGGPTATPTYNVAMTGSTYTGGETEEGDATSIGLKLRGLPYQVTLEDIKAFFQGYAYKQGSIKIG